MTNDVDAQFAQAEQMRISADTVSNALLRKVAYDMFREILLSETRGHADRDAVLRASVQYGPAFSHECDMKRRLGYSNDAERKVDDILSGVKLLIDVDLTQVRNRLLELICVI